jgi:6-phosphofructokinase 2
METIITITFNPALDKSISVPELISEKKLKCSAPVYEPGGGGINVARAIKKLGGDAAAVYLAGGDTGKKITALLSDENIKSIVTKTQFTRENLIVADIATGKQYLFDMQGPLVREREWQECLRNLEKIEGLKYIVASGSLPRGVPADIFAQIASIANKKNAKLIVDTSGEALKQAVQAGVYMIKPNLRELASLVGKEELSADKVAVTAKELVESGKCEVVVVSLGALGAILVTRDICLSINPPELKIKSTVGAGDSLVAGIVYSLVRNKSLVEAAQYGVACGAAATMNPGTELCSKVNADEVYAMIRNKEAISL